MMHYADASAASNGFNFPELAKKKKKRKERLNEPEGDQPVKASPSLPPSFEHSSISTWFVEDSEASETCRKKTNNIKAGKEISDSESDATWISTDCELNSKVGTNTCVRHKKKRKHQPSEQEDGRDLCIPETPEKATSLHPVTPLIQRLDLYLQEEKEAAESDKTAEFCSPIAQKKKKRKKGEPSEEASSQFETSDLENAGYVYDSTHVKKKKKAKGYLLTEQAGANRASERLTDIGAHSPSLQKQNKTDCSDTEDTQKDLVSPSPPAALLTQHSDRSPEERKEAAESDETAEFCSPIARKKKKKRKKGEPSEEASSQFETSDLENAGYVYDSTHVKKKKKAKGYLLTEQAGANRASERLTDIGAHSPSLQKQNKTDCSDTEDTQKDLVSPSPPAALLTQHSDRSPEERKEAAESDETAEFCSPIARKKKKRKKGEPSEEASSQFETSDLENAGYVYDSTHVKKKKKAKGYLLTEQAGANRASERLTDIGAHSPSLQKQNKTDCSDTEDTQKDLVSPSPPAALLTQHSDRSPEERKEAAESDETAEFCSPIARKKKKKRKKGEPSEEASSQFETTDLENAGLHKHSTTNCSDTEDMKEDFTHLPPPVPLTQPSDFSQKENNVVNELDRTVKYSTPAARKKKSRKHKNAPSMNDSDSAKADLAMEETVAKPEQPQQPGSSLQLPTSEADDVPQTPASPVHSDAEKSSSSNFSLLDNEFVEFSQLALKDLDSATKELEEYIPHIRTLSDSAIKQLAGRDLVRFRNFKKKGIKVRFGKFSKKENDQLRRNVEAFLEATGIESAEKLLFAHRFPEERDSITKLKTINLFGAKIAEGIPRPWRLVYYRARKMYDPKNYNGRYSEEEKKQLKKYQAKYGNNWKKISDLMSRSSHSVEAKFSEIKHAYNSGPWSCEETEKLVQAVKETLLSKMRGSDSASENEDEDEELMLTYENLCKGIAWSKVEAKVGTRHWRQCKHKWISFVTTKIMGKQIRRSRLEHLRITIALIERLYEMDADDVEEVDWEEIAKAIGNVPPYYIRSRYYRIKAYRIPHWNNKSFTEIIYHLYEVTLPVLKKKHKELMTRMNITEEPQQPEDHSWERVSKRVFKFSDIFHDSNCTSDDDSDDDQEN